MNFSDFGTRFSSNAGILSLMDDLGNAMAEGNMIMMGGGNPGHVPEIQQALQQELQKIAADPVAFQKLIGIYDPPRGDKEFLAALAGLLREEYGWNLGPENICLTNGSQGSFFLLFNMLAGRFSDGSKKKILLPMAPEYIGYADLGMCDDFFTTVKPRIDRIDQHTFKYRVDFNSINITSDIATICVSRPTNPTGNVLTDEEIDGLSTLARDNNIPFILDSAYGVPFPGIMYTDATPVWNEDMVVCMSLSKFGLPAVRTGIVVANPEIVQAISGANAICNLAPGSFGAMLTTAIVANGEILRLSKEVVGPFYKARLQNALAAVEDNFQGLDYMLHTPEGAMFLWLWLEGLPISSNDLYERLKKRGVLVVSGHYFFPGMEPGWRHTQECLRLTYSQDEEDVRQGLAIIADEVRAVQAGR